MATHDSPGDNSESVDKGLLDTDTTFGSFQLDDRLLKSIAKMGFQHPTLIQSTAIPLILQGKDVLARAKTGSGKTAAYSIPIIQSILLKKEVRISKDSRRRASCFLFALFSSINPKYLPYC